MQHESFRRDRFHVVTMISNPVRYSSRYKLYLEFEKRMEAEGVNLWTVELQLGDRPFCVTSAANPRNVQLRHWDELWHKENALNVAISRLPDDWETVAWIDADVEFVRKDWVEETLHQLQVYQVVQMFETAIDLGPNGQALATHKSFMSQYINNGAEFPETAYEEKHPGYCWAARREALDGIGGLFDRAILGAGDRHMALAFVGRAESSFHPDTTSDYKRSILLYQERCNVSLRRDVGYVPGTILHYWHGRKKDRRYYDRWRILVDNNYIPWKDVKYDSYGILQLHDDMTERFLKLRDSIRAYFRARNEDSIDLV